MITKQKHDLAFGGESLVSKRSTRLCRKSLISFGFLGQFQLPPQIFHNIVCTARSHSFTVQCVINDGLGDCCSNCIQIIIKLSQGRLTHQLSYDHPHSMQALAWSL